MWRQWRCGRLVLLALLALTSACPLAQAEECLHYEPDLASLEGTLQLKAFPGPPHYKSVEFGDQPEVVWLLTLAKPVCIAALANDPWDIAREGVQTIEIIPRTSFALSLNGMAVRVQGTLSRAHGGHPHAEILLQASRVNPLQP